MTVGNRDHLMRGVVDVLNEVKAQVRAERERRGWTQRDMADRMGTSQGQYGAWELVGFRQDCFVSSIFRAAHVLGMDVRITLTPRQPPR